MDAVGGAVYSQASGDVSINGLAVENMPSLAFPALALFGLLISPLASSASIPSPSSLKSDVTLLFNNDLDCESLLGCSSSHCWVHLISIPNIATSAATHSSVLLLSAPHTHGSASSACSALGESLLPVNKTFFQNDLVPLLRFQTFEGNFLSSQQFWVANQGNICQTVNAKGAVSSSRSCLQSLPVLCTQSAGPKAVAQSQTSFTVHSQDLAITGYVPPSCTS